MPRSVCIKGLGAYHLSDTAKKLKRDAGICAQNRHNILFALAQHNAIYVPVVSRTTGSGVPATLLNTTVTT